MLKFLLCPRPGADDVLVLKQELINAQKYMDQMTRDREKEKEKLENEFRVLQDKHLQ